MIDDRADAAERQVTKMDEQLTKVAAHHDAWAGTYDADIAGMWLYNRITLDNIRRFVPDEQGAVVLDAGGGTGMWSIELARMGYGVVLVDISEGMLRNARKNVATASLEHLIEIRQADILSMPEFADGSFAMVLCEGDPLSYCGDHRQAMREMARVLRPGGALVASVDGRASALGWLRDADIDEVQRFLETGNLMIPPDYPEETRYACHAFTPTEIRELYESSGLTVERIIGKPVLRGLSVANSDDPVVRERRYQLESKYCDHPDFVSLGPHLEIAGRKR